MPDAGCRAARAFAVLLLTAVAASTTTAQGPRPTVAPGAGGADSARLVGVARDIIRSARFAALITLDATTGSAARTVDPAPPDSAMIVRFVTKPRSRKVTQMVRDPRVTLYYFDAGALRYVSLHGRAREVRDSGEKARRWHAEWTPFYPQRERGAAMFEVIPTRLEVVSERDGVVGDTLRWRVPSLRLRPRVPR